MSTRTGGDAARGGRIPTLVRSDRLNHAHENGLYGDRRICGKRICGVTSKNTAYSLFP